MGQLPLQTIDAKLSSSAKPDQLPGMETRSEIQEWRRSQRRILLDRRKALTRSERARCATVVTQRLEQQVPELAGASVGFYWPFRGELDLRDFAKSLHLAGARLSLPVVVEKAEPLQFWRWQPGTKLALGVWRIPIPAQRVVDDPTILIVPLLGFDEAGFRLGNGGGYYDRTLAALEPRPYTIGVGYELGRLQSIHPQPHDIPMDVITTEACVARFGSSRRSSNATRPGSEAALIAAGQRSQVPGNDTYESRHAIDEKLDAALECTFPASDPFNLL